MNVQSGRTPAMPTVRAEIPQFDALGSESPSDAPTRRKWSSDEEAVLRVWYEKRAGGHLDVPALMRLLGRSEASVVLKARKMGLTDSKRLRAPRVDGLRPSDLKRQPKYAGVEDRFAALSKIRSENLRIHGHPRGALGMKHTAETKATLACKSRDAKARMTAEQKEAVIVKRNATNIERYGTGNPAMLSQDGPYSRAKRGRREDLDNQFFRSRWEANYARYLNFLIAQRQILKWEYEPETFVFHGVTRGVLTYKPDFKVFEMDGSYAWHEIKGWMDATSKAKLKRMAKFYPNEKVIVIGEDEYRALLKWQSLIPGWEVGKDGRPPTDEEVEEAARSSMAITNYLREKGVKGE